MLHGPTFFATRNFIEMSRRPSWSLGGVAKTNHPTNEMGIPVRHMKTVLPALHHGADDLQVVPENCPLGVEAVLHQELQQPVGEHFVLGVTLDR